MRQRIGLALVAVVAMIGGVYLSSAEQKPADGAKPLEHRPFGLEKRTPWTTSKVRGSPEPPSPYKTELAFPKLKFDEPLDITNAPGTERLFVTERYGRVFSFPNDPKVAK